MSVAPIQVYTKQTLSKALLWLDQQPKEWSQNIKSANKAVQLYLQHQNQEKKDKAAFFKTELKKYCDKETTFEKSPPEESLIDLTPMSPPANKPQTSKESFPYSLDSNSQDLIQKTKEGLNLQSSEEALRALIQVGYKSLKDIVSS